MAQGERSILGYIAIVLAALSIYFLPAAVAHIRFHHQRGAITVLNTFLGWTLIGWVVALVWASSQVKAEAN